LKKKKKKKKKSFDAYRFFSYFITGSQIPDSGYVPFLFTFYFILF
jgi:hypothetical protein